MCVSILDIKTPLLSWQSNYVFATKTEKDLLSVISQKLTGIKGYIVTNDPVIFKFFICRSAIWSRAQRRLQTSDSGIKL